MDIALAPDIERRLVEAVANGRFADTGVAVAEALQLLFARDDARLSQFEADVQIGLDEAERGDFVAGDEVQAEILRRLAERRRT